jgi:NADH dehydrogenase (ubiquinone) Fe-S protein 2
MQNLKFFNINFGPQHPAAHGVLRLILSVAGEIVLKAEPHIGLLHRGTEKLVEYKTAIQALPYFDRLDYVSMLANEHTYSITIERFLKSEAPIRIQYIRVMYVEMTRILNHLMSITTHAMDVGALTPFLWMFEEREKLMEFYERACGARMHANFIRPCGLSFDLPSDLCHDIYKFIEQFNFRVNEMEELLTSNRIWKSRLVNVGIVNRATAINYNFSGVLLRGSGLAWDLRKSYPYEIYHQLKFSIPIGIYGDCYDRYILRIYEMRESASIMFQCLEHLKILAIDQKFNLLTKENNTKSVNASRLNMKNNMESIIHHFKYFSNNLRIETQEGYLSTEAPKGEFGVFLIYTGHNKIYRCKIKAPGFFHLQGLNRMGQNHLIADIVTIIGTQDIVFGEVDR